MWGQELVEKTTFGPPGTTLPVRQRSKFSIGDQEIRYQTSDTTTRDIKTNTNLNTNTIKNTNMNTAGQLCQCGKDQGFQLEIKRSDIRHNNTDI